MERITWMVLLLVLQVLIPRAISNKIEPMEPIAATYAEPFNITCKATITSQTEGVRLKQLLPRGEEVNIYTMLTVGGEDNSKFDTHKYSVTQLGGQNFIITVKSPVLADATRYRCGLIYKDEIKETTTVAILRAPTIQGKKNIKVGEIVEFTCDAQYQVPTDLDQDSEADLLPQIRATIGGVVQKGVNTRHLEGRITETWNATNLGELDDQTDLVCEAYTIKPQHSIKKATKLNIMYKVQNIALIPTFDTYSVDEKINCTAQGNPPPRTEWESINTKAGKNVGSQLLIVNNMVGDHLEEWKCVASNIFAGKHEEIEKLITFSVVRGTDTPTGEKKTAPTAAIAAGASVGAILFVIIIAVIIILVLRRRKQAPKVPPEDAIATGPFSDPYYEPRPTIPEKPTPASRSLKPNSNGHNVGFGSHLSPNNDVDDKEAELARRALTPVPRDDHQDDVQTWSEREKPRLSDLTSNVAPPSGSPPHEYPVYPHQDGPPPGSSPMEHQGYSHLMRPPTPPTPTEYPDIAAAHPGLQQVYAKQNRSSREALNTEV